MIATNERIDAFWGLFRRHQAELAAAKSADDPPYDELLAALQDVDPRLYLEFSNTDQPSELVITADGDKPAFEAARAVARSAPPLEGWTVRALKPKLGFPETVSWQGCVLDISRVVFIPLTQGEDLSVGLRLLVPDVPASDLEHAHNAILRAIDHGLGEERHAMVVQFTEIAPLASGSIPPDAIPLVELERYIERRSRRPGGAG